MKIKLVFILVTLSLSTSIAQLPFYEINGYGKYLFSSTKLPDASERYDDHLIHLRFNTRWYPLNNLRAILELRLRGYYGESVEKIPDFVNQIKGNYDYLNLDAVLWDKTKTVGYAEIDRLYTDWNHNKLQVTLGRQRIAWGTSWTWNPTDIFNPLSVLDFDYEERPAVDAIRAQYYTGAVSKVEFAFKPAKETENIIAAGLLSLNIQDYDINFIGGMRNKRLLAGFSWVGDISGAGFRGEILMNKGRKTMVPNSYYFFGSENIVYSFVLSGDYTFLNSFYIHTEVLYNNIGVEDSTSLFQKTALNLGFLSAAKWSLYQEFAYDFHPLVRATVFGLYNPNDKSFAVVPSVSYSIITNLDILILMMIFNGDELTEYGNYGNTLFIRLKYSF